MVDALALVARFFLAGVFVVAAVAKLRDRAGTTEALKSFGIPSGAARPATFLLPGAEAAAAVLLVMPATYLVGAIWSLVLLAAFTVAIGANLARGNRVECRCFGEASTTPIGPTTVARNVVLMLLAVLVAAAAPTTVGGTVDWVEALDGDGTALAVVSGLLLVLVALEAWALVRLRASHRALEAQLTSLTTPGPSAIPIGAEAPAFELPTADGGSLALSTLLERGKPVVLTFTDPNCGPCQTLVPQLAMWQQSLANVFTIGIVSRGKRSENASHATEHGLSEVMVQDADEIAETYGSQGTPSAVLVSPNGRVDSHVATGAEQINDLFEHVIAEHAQSLWQQATGERPPLYPGLRVGTEAPDLIVSDLEGGTHSLRELVRMPTLLVFWSPRCGFCHQMVDDMRALEARLPADAQLVFSTLGTVEENRYMGLKSVMLRDDEFTLGAAFKASGTPAAVLFEEGKVASPLESGVDAVLQLSERLAGPLPHRVASPTIQ